jgi:hypothetical protein
LRREGKYFQEMAFAHAITETAPGHASLFTGKLPREHGIVANDVLGPDGKKQATVADKGESSKIVGLDGRALGACRGNAFVSVGGPRRDGLVAGPRGHVSSLA